MMVPMTQRLIIWTHIGIGVLAGVTILIMSVTGDSGTGGEVGERTELDIDTGTGRVVRISRFADSSLAQRLRGLVRFALTGAEGVLAGQVVAAVAFAGGVLLVWTGLSLALGRLRRLWSRRYENCAVDQFLSGSTNRASTVILIGVSFCLNAVSDSASMVFRLASMP
jgi:hypothetical protein